MRPTTMASEMENSPSSCHLRGASCLARSDTVMIKTVQVDINTEAQGTGGKETRINHRPIMDFV